MKRVYFVRHGQSEANAKGVINFPHTPLTEAGLKEAEKIAERFKKIPVDFIISSTYPRARQTADAIARHKNLPVIESELFIETRNPSEIRGTSSNDPTVKHIREIRQKL